MANNDSAKFASMPSPAAPASRPPSHRSGIDSFIVMDVMQRAAVVEAKGEHVIHMEVGQPATPAPRAAREALKAAIDRENLGYTRDISDPLLTCAPASPATI